MTYTNINIYYYLIHKYKYYYLLLLEALSREFREGLPMELLYTELLCSDCGNKGIITREGEEMEGGMEKKKPRVNAGKTKIMWCQVSKGQVEDSGEHPCGVCSKGV